MDGLSETNVSDKFLGAFPIRVVTTDSITINTSVLLHLPRTAFNYAIILSKHMDASQEALDVHKCPHLLNIFPIQLRFLFYFQLISTINLSPTCQTRFHIVSTIFISLGCQQILIPKTRSGTDHGHVPNEDIPDLWKFIQAVCT